MSSSDSLLQPCAECRRHIRVDAPTCQFCGAAHVARPVQKRRVARTRLALAGGAALMLAACGTPEGDTSDNSDSEESTGGGETEASCAAPPYGAPPFDETIV